MKKIKYVKVIFNMVKIQIWNFFKGFIVKENRHIFPMKDD